MKSSAIFFISYFLRSISAIAATVAAVSAVAATVAAEAASAAVGTGFTGFVGNLVFGNKSFHLDERISSGEVESALIVDGKYFNDDLVTDRDNIFYLFNALDVEVADVYHAFFAGSDFNKSTEAHESCDNTLVNSTDFGIVCDGVDDIKCLLGIVEIGGGNEYGTVVFDVDLDVAFCADLLDDLALLTDDITDLFNVDLGGEHLGSILGKFCSGFCDAGKHDFVKDLAACNIGLFECFLDDFGSQTVHLGIHLDGGDTLLGAADLEVHIAEEVFKTLNVNHGHETVAFGNKTAGDTCNGSLDGNTGCHQRKRGAADGCLRSGAVGGQNFGNKADGVGEFFHRGKYGDECSFGKCAVTDLTSAGASGGLGFTDRVCREVVVVDVSLGFFFVDTVKHLCFTEETVSDGSKRRRISLVPANDRYPVIEVGEGSDFIMWGVVTYVIKKVR